MEGEGVEVPERRQIPLLECRVIVVSKYVDTNDLVTAARALRRRQDLQAFYDQHPSYAPTNLRRWCSGTKRSRLPPIKNFVTLVENHWDGIIAWHHNHLSNDLLEGINSPVQAAKARARGYRNKNKMITIVYLTAAKLQLPTLTSPTPAYMPSR
ncbi:MAG: transposase [Pseudonocardiaceae bacterium]